MPALIIAFLAYFVFTRPSFWITVNALTLI
jgi:hypothetical protein